MQKILVVLASLTLAVSAWGQLSKSIILTNRWVEVPIQNCFGAIEHRSAILIWDSSDHYPEVGQGFIVRKVVLLSEPQNRLDAGYYELFHSLYSDILLTRCRHSSF